MNEEKINALKDALREVVQMITAREGPMPEDLKALLVQVMEHVATRIQQLRAEESPVETLPPKLEPGTHPSSNVNSFGYNPETEQLAVKFQDKYPGQNGPEYIYEGVKPYIYDVFRRGAVAPKNSGGNQWHKYKKGVTPSLGASLSALVKNGNHSYTKIS